MNLLNQEEQKKKEQMIEKFLDYKEIIPPNSVTYFAPKNGMLSYSFKKDGQTIRVQFQKDPITGAGRVNLDRKRDKVKIDFLEELIENQYTKDEKGNKVRNPKVQEVPFKRIDDFEASLFTNEERLRFRHPVTKKIIEVTGEDVVEMFLELETRPGKLKDKFKEIKKDKETEKETDKGK